MSRSWLPWKTKTQILLEEIEYLRSQVAQLQNYVLIVGPQIAAPAAPVPSSVPLPDEAVIQLHRNGMAADIDWELQEGLIDEEEWARKMDDVDSFNELN